MPASPPPGWPTERHGGGPSSEKDLMRRTIKPALPDVGASARLIARSLPGGGPGGPPLLLDLCGVRALTASDLGQLVALHNRLAASGGRLVVVNAGPAAAGVLGVARLNGLFEVRLAA